MKILLGKVRDDGGTQARGRVDPAVVDDYAELLKDHAFDFPEVVVFHDGADYWLADGFHRRGAYYVAGRLEMPCQVLQGTKRDALKYALSANATQGMRRTAEDRKNAVLKALKDEEWGKWSDSEIGRLCAVSHTYVFRIRASLATVASEATGAETTEGTTRTYRARGGKQTTMRIGNIGKNKGGGKKGSKGKGPASAPTPHGAKGENGDSREPPASARDDPRSNDAAGEEHSGAWEPAPPADSAGGKRTSAARKAEEGLGVVARALEDLGVFEANRSLLESLKRGIAHAQNAGPDPPPVEDEAGAPLPENAVPAFSQLPELRKLCRLIDDAGREADRICSLPVGAYVLREPVKTFLHNARSNVWQNRPAHACPAGRRCGARCKLCDGRGFVTKRIYESHQKAHGH